MQCNIRFNIKFYNAKSRSWPRPDNKSRKEAPMKNISALPAGVTIHAPIKPGYSTILTHDALAFTAKLARKFESRRRELMAARAQRQAAFDAGSRPGFPAETASVRESQWT